jgi:hypothetical protein
MIVLKATWDLSHLDARDEVREEVVEARELGHALQLVPAALGEPGHVGLRRVQRLGRALVTRSG